MGKKIRQRLAKEAAKAEADMAALQKKSLPKKQSKKTAPIQLPAVRGRYPAQRPINRFKTVSCSPGKRSANLFKYLYYL
ncbi:MAG: hypothetical protein K2H64_02555 [Desulfovibrio sp.]|nr:hypothetical protein [Desulfovibrio sp.]